MSQVVGWLRSPIMMAAVGAAAGLAGVTAAMPWLRQVDPLGLTPVVLVSLMGGAILGWYARGVGSRSAVSDDRPH